MEKYTGIIKIVNKKGTLVVEGVSVAYVIDFAKNLKNDLGCNTTITLTILENKSLHSIPYYSIYKQLIF